MTIRWKQPPTTPTQTVLSPGPNVDRAREPSGGLPSAGNGWRGIEAAPRPPRPSVALPVALVAGIWGLAVAVPLQWVWAVPAGMLAIAALAWWRLAPADDPFSEIDLARGDRLAHRGSGRGATVVRAGQLARQTGMVEVKWSDSWVCERYPAHDFTPARTGDTR